MVKLQMIQKSDGGVVHHVNLPKEVVEQARFCKGDILEVKCLEIGKVLIIKKREGGE